MNIKRYVADTEKEAMEMVKKDLGLDAVIINIKRMDPKGLGKLFKKPSVEVLAALEQQSKEEPVVDQNKEEELKQLESKINQLEKMLKQQEAEKQEVSQHIEEPVEKIESTNSQYQAYKNDMIELVYQHLIDNDVNEEIAMMLVKGIKSRNMNEVVANVYKRLVKILDKAEPIQHDSQQRISIFVGTTGVGKTTTVAKIAANLIINNNKRVGLITTDTYRIAAVEQLKTYGKILSIPVKVAYSPTDLREAIKEYADMDIILIDSAGCSQKNENQFRDTVQMLAEVPEADMYLVLSLVTKYKDMAEILEKYNPYKEVRVIFSKQDETNSIGNVINIKCRYSAKLSYITTGQNVPDDIEIVAPQQIAKRLLGGEMG